MPKIYFYDTGLACSLLGIEGKNQLATHHLKGNLFENFILCELVKHRYNLALRPNYYFWRDKTGHEIDCIVEEPDKLIPIEIKCGKTPSNEFFANLKYWNKLSGNNPKNSFVIYGGEGSQHRAQGNLLNWANLESLEFLALPKL